MNKIICQQTFFLISITIISGCSLFGSNNNYPTTNDDYTTTIPLPPQKLNASNAAAPVNPGHIKTTPASAPKSNTQAHHTNSYPQQIQEERSNGTVTEIKVNNGNDLPNYYMYPSQQNTSSKNNSDSNITTPTWQISW